MASENLRISGNTDRLGQLTKQLREERSKRSPAPADRSKVVIDFASLRIAPPLVGDLPPAERQGVPNQFVNLVPEPFRGIAQGFKSGNLQGNRDKAFGRGIEIVPKFEQNIDGTIVRDEEGRFIVSQLELTTPETRISAAIEAASIGRRIEAEVERPLMADVALTAAGNNNFGLAIAAMAVDPIGVIGFLAAESLARNPIATVLGYIPIAGTYIGTYLGERRGRFAGNLSEIIAENGGDPNNAEDIFLALSSKEAVTAAWEEATAGAIGTALTETVIEAITFGFSRKFIPINVGGKIVKSLAIFGSESLGEAAGEIGGQIATGEDINLTEAFIAGMANMGQSVSTTLGTMGVQAALEKGLNQLPAPDFLVPGGLESSRAFVSEGSMTATMEQMEALGLTNEEITNELLGNPTRNPDVFESLSPELKGDVIRIRTQAQAYKKIDFEQGWDFFSFDPELDATQQLPSYDELIARIEETKRILPPLTDEQTDLVTNATQGVLAKVREALGLDAIPQGERKAWNRAISTAKAKGLDQQAFRIAQRLFEDPEYAYTEEVQAGLALGAAVEQEIANKNFKKFRQLHEAGKHEQARIYFDRAMHARDRFDLISKGVHVGRSSVGRILSAGQSLLFKDDYTLTTIIAAAEAARGGDPLGLDLTSEFTKLAEAEALAKADVQRLQETQVEMETRKLKEAAEIVHARRVKREGFDKQKEINIVRRQEIDAEIEVLKQQFRDLGGRANDVIGLTADGFAIVAKIALKYMQKGLLNFSDLIAKLQQDFPDLTKDDAYEVVLSLDDTVAKQVQAQAAKSKADVDRARQIITELEKIRTKDPQKANRLLQEMKALSRSIYATDEQKIAKIQRQIDSVRKKLPPKAKVVPPKQRVSKEVEARAVRKAQEELRQLKRALRLEQEAARLDQLREEGRPERRPLKNKLLVEEVPELRDAKIRLEIARRNINRAIVAQRKISLIKGREVLGEVNSLLRTLMATADMSSLLRQGLPLTVANPILAQGAITGGIASFFSPNRADALNIALREHPNYLRHLEHGIQYTTFGTGRTQLEELYQSNLIRKIPAFRELNQYEKASGKAVIGLAKEVIDASERIMVTHLNMLRFAVFDQFLDPDLGISDEALDLAARYVNEATGRGTLSAGTIRLLNGLLFAPRFTASRIQLPVTTLRMLRHPGLRKQAAKQLAGMTTLGITVLGLASLAGLVVGLDPEDSDFGKIIIGNTRVDIFGGNQQLASLLLRSHIYAAKKWGPAKRLAQAAKDLGFEDWEQFWEADPRSAGLRDLVNSMSHFKLAPVPSAIFDIYTKETAVGEEVTIERLIASRVIPLFLQDATDAYEKEGLLAASGVAAGAFFGLSVNTFGDELKAGDIKLILKAGRNYRPSPPRYPEEIKNNVEMKESLDEIYALILATKIRSRNALFSELAEGGKIERMFLRELLEGEAADARVIMKEHIPEIESPDDPSEDLETLRQSFLDQMEKALR